MGTKPPLPREADLFRSEGKVSVETVYFLLVRVRRKNRTKMIDMLAEVPSPKKELKEPHKND